MEAQKTEGTTLLKNVSLKVLIDMKEKRILYGEADKEFIDLLFTILFLPAGTLIKLLSTDQPGTVPVPLSNLYRSIDAMNTINYFEPNQHVQNLLIPKTYYLCNNYRQNRSCNYIISTYGAKCPNCKGSMTINFTYVYGSEEARPIDGGYVKGTTFSKYMVMDDLTVKPMSYSSMLTISVLHELNVDIQERLFHLDINEALKMLKASFHTPTVLTDVLLPQIDFTIFDGN